MQTLSPSSFARLKRYLADYKPQLEAAAMAINTLEALATDTDKETLTQALADLHVSATVLGSYAEGMVNAIDQFTEALSTATLERGSDESKA